MGRAGCKAPAPSTDTEGGTLDLRLGNDETIGRLTDTHTRVVAIKGSVTGGVDDGLKLIEQEPL